MTVSVSIRKRNFIHSLEKGLSLLNLFSQLGAQASLSELAKAANMGLGTATRYVQTLMELGYLNRDPLTKKYRLAPKILSLGFSLLKDMDLRARITPHLSEITREFGVGSQCAILDETEIVYVERFRARSLVALDLTIGSRIPAFCTALGRAILAFLDTESMQRIVGKMNMASLTPYTITNKRDLFRELDLTRKRGYAINMQELVLGQSGLAAPIFQREAVEGAFGFSFPQHLMRDEKFQETLIDRMKEIAHKVSIGQRNENLRNTKLKT
jgi:IclR family transcriptional regulator, pca regulon regulatory protein